MAANMKRAGKVYYCDGEDDKPTVSFRQRAELGDVLYSQYESRSELCDVTLVINGKKGRIVGMLEAGLSEREVARRTGRAVSPINLCVFKTERKAHWSVLMVSPYFEALYQSRLAERQSGRITLELEDRASVEAIVKYMYTGKVKITMRNVRALLRTADYFLLSNFRLSCESYFSSTRGPELCNENCVELCLLGGEFGLQSLYQRASNHIIDNFVSIAMGEELLPLSDETIQMFVKEKRLAHIKPEFMFGFIVTWTEYDLKNRERYFAELFCSLELQKFTKNSFKTTVEGCPLVSKNPECEKYISEFKNQLEDGILRYLPENSDTKEVFLIWGGYPQNGCVQPLGYIVDDNRWTTRTSMASNLKMAQCMTVCLSDDTIVMTDGTQRDCLIALHCKDYNQTFYIYSLDAAGSDWNWSSKDVPCPAKGFQIHNLTACGTTVYCICSLEQAKSTTVWKLYEVVLHNPRRHGPRVKLLSKCKLFTTTEFLPNSQTCVLQGRYICVTVGLDTKPENSTSHLAVVDTQKLPRGLVYSSCKVVYYPVLCPIGDKLVMINLATQKTAAFRLETKKITDCPQFVIERPLPLSVNRRNYMYRFHYNKLYVFGGELGFRRLDTCFCYCFREGVWQRLHDLPLPMDSGVMFPRLILKSDLRYTHCYTCQQEHLR